MGCVASGGGRESGGGVKAARLVKMSLWLVLCEMALGWIANSG